MKEGEPELGGIQVPHNNTTEPTLTSGTNPVNFDSFQNTQSSQNIPTTPTASPQPTQTLEPVQPIANHPTFHTSSLHWGGGQRLLI